jgi:hypothetical protein
MKKYILFLTFVSLLFSECSRYEDLLDSSIKPGYIYCSDGSIIHPAQYDESSKKAIGIIFWTNPNNNDIQDKGYAVALTDIVNTQWASDNVHIDNISSNANDYLGLANTAAMIIYNENDSTISMPAIDSIQIFMNNVSWYIPSSGQLSLIYGSSKTIQESLKIVGGEKLKDWYWSSTEDNTSDDTAIQYALTVSLSNGSVVSSDKRNKYYIRPVITIR